MAKVKINAGNFKGTMKKVFADSATLATQVQHLCNFAINYYLTNGDLNCIYIKMLIDQARNSKRSGFSAPKLEGYLFEAVNIKWATDKKGNTIIACAKKSDGAVKNEQPRFKRWTEWVKEDHVAKEYTLAQFRKFLEGKVSPKEGVLIAPEVIKAAELALEAAFPGSVSNEPALKAVA